MNVLVDTDVWSEALRKGKGKPSVYVNELSDLIREGRVTMIGPIRQEILGGIREAKIFDAFAERLAAFTDRPISTGEFVMAARFFNLCRGKGIQGSNTDFLICACAVSWRQPILSKDKDYLRYREHLPIELLPPRAR